MIDRRFVFLIGVAAVAGYLTGWLVNSIAHPPVAVAWCIAGSVGYVAAYATELILDRRSKVG